MIDKIGVFQVLMTTISVSAVGMLASTLASLIESAFDLPDEIYYHPFVVELSRLTVEMSLFDNVRCSSPPECNIFRNLNASTTISDQQRNKLSNLGW